MLVLSRQQDEGIVIDGGRIVIKVLEITGKQVRLGIEAPKEVRIKRAELEAIKQPEPAVKT